MSRIAAPGAVLLGLLLISVMQSACGAAISPCRVAVIQATTSAPNQGEENYAASVVRNITRWLSELAVTHTVLTDDQVTFDRLKGLRMVILPYNPNPPASELQALRKFVDGGGRLLVCYSQDPVWADIMHVKLGPYIKAEKPGR